MATPYSTAYPMAMPQPGAQYPPTAPAPMYAPTSVPPMVPPAGSMPISPMPAASFSPTQGGWSQSNMICPPGLEYLIALDHLFVNQKVELFEAITGWETANKYSIVNIRGEPVYYVVEDSGYCARICCGSYRSCEFKVVDGCGREILRMNRPLRCDSCCFPCCLQELEVYSGDVLLGSVVQDWSLFRPWFSIRNASGDTVLTIKGPLLRFFIDVTFKVKSANREHRVGLISKKWSGISREFFTDSDVFGISFPGDLDVKMKAVLLGACLLIDFMYFEKK